jgi:hypothetical protein
LVLGPKNIYVVCSLRFLVLREFIAIIAIGVFFASMLWSSGLIECARAADDGIGVPYVVPVSEPGHSGAHKAPNYNGLLYDESSVVRGTGDVSIRSTFGASTMDSSGWLKGNGSISLESLRSLSQKRAVANFTQKSDLIFEGGQLKSRKSLQSPLFYRGLGASINERFNLSHVDKSETDIIRSINRINNTLAFSTELAFNGIWDVENQIGSGFSMKKGEQQYIGSFQTQKIIEFNDLDLEKK